jgi:hypothetical protein
LFGREEVVALLEEAYIEGFNDNGMPLATWSDNLEQNENTVKKWIDNKLNSPAPQGQ